MSNLEEKLRDVLSSAADGAPDSSVELVEAVEVRHRSRRRRGYAALAGVAVLALIGGVGFAFGDSQETRRGPTEVTVPAAQGGDTPPIAKVWPEAYHSLSAKLADGRKYQPVTLVNDHEMLVTTDASFENADELWIIDLDTRRARQLTHLPKPHENRVSFASHFTVGSGHVVWLDTYEEGDEQRTRIWKVALTGGKPALVSTVSGDYGSADNRLAVDGDAIYLSHFAAGGVRTAPLSGGDATPVQGTEGYHLLRWPWVGKPGPFIGQGMKCTVTPDFEPQCEAPESNGRALVLQAVKSFTTIRNLQTREVRKVVTPEGIDGAVCHLTFCTGSRGGGEEVAFQRDGSSLRDLPGHLTPFEVPTWDRFLVLVKGRATLLHDLKTGKSGEFALDQEPGGGNSLPGVSDPADRLLSWTIDNNKSYAIMDLAAIK